jgi:hypothetical protein
MPPNVPSRREFSCRFAGAGLVLAWIGAGRAARAAADDSPGVPPELANDAGAIHQLVRLRASPARVYGALTNAAEFDKVVRLSGVLSEMKPGALDANPTRISPEVGGAFSLFAGYISGRHVEMVPAVRLVQAWHSASWPAGCYSIARFALAADAGGTALTFDHTGFPAGTGPHLVGGWHEHYWAPLAKYFA